MIRTCLSFVLLFAALAGPQAYAAEGGAILMWQPKLNLVAEDDGEFTLTSVIMTPNGCFAPDGWAEGLPKGATTIKAAKAIQLKVKSTFEEGIFCTQAINPVVHVIPNLVFTITELYLHGFAMLGDTIQGDSLRPVIREEQKAFVAATAPPSTDWYAWADYQPGMAPRLHVRGLVQVPSHAQDVALTKAYPQGIDPTILILDLAVVPTGNQGIQVPVWRSAAYDEQNYSGIYKSVEIRHEGKSIKTIEKIHRTD